MQKMQLQDEKIADMVRRLQGSQEEVQKEKKDRLEENEKLQAECDKWR